MRIRRILINGHFSTGMAAITAMMEIFSPGDHLIATDDLYGGTLRLWNTISHKNGISGDCVEYYRAGHTEHYPSPPENRTKYHYVLPDIWFHCVPR